jgi:hypothetical protein
MGGKVAHPMQATPPPPGVMQRSRNITRQETQRKTIQTSACAIDSKRDKRDAGVLASPIMVS